MARIAIGCGARCDSIAHEIFERIDRRRGFGGSDRGGDATAEAAETDEQCGISESHVDRAAFRRWATILRWWREAGLSPKLLWLS